MTSNSPSEPGFQNTMPSTGLKERLSTSNRARNLGSYSHAQNKSMKWRGFQASGFGEWHVRHGGLTTDAKRNVSLHSKQTQ